MSMICTIKALSLHFKQLPLF